jgi:alpha-tubulin suppressor-like RCC1 family protein
MMNRTLNNKFRISTTMGVALSALLSACGGGGGGDSAAPPAAKVSTLAAGGGSSCRIDGSTASLSCWGMNDMGQLGHGTSGSPSSTPLSVNLGAGRTALAVALGVDHACAILDDQSVACWGSNAQAQMGQPANLLANATPVMMPGLKAQALSLGATHSCALTPSGTVQCWGSNSKGQLGQSISALTQSITPVTVAGLSSIKAVVSGYNFSCALSTTGTVQCWGDNQSGQLGNASTTDSATPVQPIGLSGVQTLAAGAYHVCAATASTVSCWGRNDQGQLGHSTGTPLVSSPTAVPSVGAGITQLGAGSAHSCALSSTGSVNCWGSNTSKQLSGAGAGGTSPVSVTLSGASQIALGATHSCAQLGSTNQTQCWGAGTSGRLGPNASADSASAVVVP